jgi:hypothetical protein
LFVFFWEHLDRIKGRGAARQLAGIRQFIEEFSVVFLFKKKLNQGKQWKTIIILLNFALSNGLSTWGVKYISSGLGAILNASSSFMDRNNYFF